MRKYMYMYLLKVKKKTPKNKKQDKLEENYLKFIYFFIMFVLDW